MKIILIDKILINFLDNWNDYFNFKKPLQINYLLIKTEVGKIFVYFMADRSSEPFSFAKIALANGPHESIKREFRNIIEFKNIMPEFFEKRVPKILFYIENEEGTALISSYVNGNKIKPCSNYLISNNKKNKNIIMDVYDSWKEFNSNNTKQSINIYEFNEYVNNIVRKFSIKLHYDKYLTNELFNIKTEILKLDLLPFQGPVHGDFWKDNIIIKYDNIYIVDWEKSKLNGFPIFDIYLFCFTYFDDDSFLLNCDKSYDELDEINKLLRYTIFNALNYLSLNKYQAFIMMELFLYEMCVQGYLFYDKLTRADYDWRNRLNFFLKNKKNFEVNFFDDKFIN